MSRGRKILIGVGMAAVVGVLAARAVMAGGEDAVTVRTEDVERRDLVAKVRASGHIEPKRSVDISADISGRIVELPVEEGENVREGDLLLIIDPTQYEAALQRAEAALAEARAREVQARTDYTQARRDADRLSQLKERTEDLVTDQEVEQAVTVAEVKESLWEAAQHGVAIAQAAVSEARDRVDKTVIRAPMTGRITRLSVEKGETAIVGTMNNPGSLLLTVADLSEMEAVIEVDETDVPEISIGDSASVEIDAFPNRRFVGRVTKIGNSSIRPVSSVTSTASDQAIDFEVRIALDEPPEEIRPDLSATANVVTATRDDVLAIPIIALTLIDEEDFELLENELTEDGQGGESPFAGKEASQIEGVYVVEEGNVVRFTPVEIGITGDSYFEVVDGLAEGQTVVSGSYQAIRELRDGTHIEVEKGDARSTSGES
ncbi:MAG: efflux RND transporter periplasmic adaptor subunit [Gemmatimonadales bacterium]|jgi:HlyD family secretion protein